MTRNSGKSLGVRALGYPCERMLRWPESSAGASATRRAVAPCDGPWPAAALGPGAASTDLLLHC